MFNETSFGDAFNPGKGNIPVWQQLQFGTKAMWKQAGRPTDGATTAFNPPPGLPTLPGSGVDGSATTIDPATGLPTTASASSSTSSSLSSLFAGIPSTYLLIGAAIILVMVMKK